MNERPRFRLELATPLPEEAVHLVCHCIKCRHNSARRSGGKSIGLCDYRHVWLDSDGKCTAMDRRDGEGEKP